MDEEEVKRISLTELREHLEEANREHDVILARLNLRRVISHLLVTPSLVASIVLLFSAGIYSPKTLIALAVYFIVLVGSIVLVRPWVLRHASADEVVNLYETERQRRIELMG